MTMRAWQVRQWCEPEGMKWAGVPVPEPGPGQVRVRNRAAALNFFDILQIQGKYQIKPPFPFTPGAEVGGIVDAVGSGVNGLAAGDKVLAMVMQGAFAEFSIAPADRVFRIPDAMDFPEAAAMRDLLKAISIVGVFWGECVREHPGFLAETQQALDAMYRAGQVRPAIGKRYRLDKVPAGLRDLAERRVIGKAVALI